VTPFTGGFRPFGERRDDDRDVPRILRRMSVLRISIAVLAVLACAACGSRAVEPKPVPDLVGMNLQQAEDELDSRGLGHDAVGGGTFGIVVRSNWQVCRQVPVAGKKAKAVTLHLARGCTVGIPDVRRMSLEDADDELERAGVAWRAETPDGDTVIVKHLWEVCDQERGADRSVTLYIDRDCLGWTG
jgi:hypothetical protein